LGFLALGIAIVSLINFGPSSVLLRIPASLQDALVLLIPLGMLISIVAVALPKTRTLPSWLSLATFVAIAVWWALCVLDNPHG
jgi:hypothetical protein